MSSENKIFNAALELCKAMNNVADNTLPKKIASVVKSCAVGATASALASAWIPGIGATIAVGAGATFIWGMYAKINNLIGLSLSENLLKTIASGVLTNLAAYATVSVGVGTVLSFIPGIGSIGASAIIGGSVYAATIGSGIVYLKILTNLFSTGIDPAKVSTADFERKAKDVMQTEDIEEIMKQAKEEYKKK